MDRPRPILVRAFWKQADLFERVDRINHGVSISICFLHDSPEMSLVVESRSYRTV